MKQDIQTPDVVPSGHYLSYVTHVNMIELVPLQPAPVSCVYMVCVCVTCKTFHPVSLEEIVFLEACREVSWQATSIFVILTCSLTHVNMAWYSTASVQAVCN